MKTEIKVGIDGRALRGFIEGSRTGIARYSWEVCSKLSKILPQAKFIVYTPVDIEIPLSSANWRSHIDSNKFLSKLPAILWTKYRCGKLVAQDDLDIFWGAASFLPKLPKNVKTILTVYDLTYKVAPQTMEFRHRLAFKTFLSNDVKVADRITTISNGTSDRIFKEFGRRPDEIIYPAIQEHFLRDSAPNLGLLDKLNLKNPFILSVGTFEPRKNILLLIKALATLKQQGKQVDTDLVLVGGRGWKSSPLYDEIQMYEWIKHLGFQDDEVLAHLYQECELFAFPSIYEGFGMPLLEARYFGSKIVALDTPELREAAGSSAYFARNDPQSFAEALTKCYESKHTIKQEKLEWPSWDDAANQIYNLIVE